RRRPAVGAHRWLRLEVETGEVDDPAGCLPDIAHAMGNAGWDAQEPRRAVAQHEPHAHALRLRALTDVDEHDEHAVTRGHVPDVGLAGVEVERLDRARRLLAVVDLAQREPSDRRGPSVTEPRQLGQRAAVVRESLELDELDAVDGRRGPV